MFTIQVLITLLIAKSTESCKSSSPCDLGRFYPPAPPKEGQNWMSKIDGKESISDLSIPGTHDSAASPCAEIDKLICPWTQTQYWSILGQLEAGIRYFDLRCRHYHNGCPLHHGPVYLHANLRSAVQDVVKYIIIVISDNISNLTYMHLDQNCGAWQCINSLLLERYFVKSN